MKLSKRETRLIEQFMTQGMNLTANELAAAAKVSTKPFIGRSNGSMRLLVQKSFGLKSAKDFVWIMKRISKGRLKIKKQIKMMSRLNGVMRLHCIYCLNHRSV